MTENELAVTVQESPAAIGPRPGLISADHDRWPDEDEWWMRRPESAGHWVIPGVWPWGYMPLLTGQPKAGKTSLVVELVASLLIPGRRFLDRFEPSGLTPEDRHRGITLINAETPVGALVEELVTATEEDPEARRWLDPIHLVEEGGAAVFDLTDPSLFDQWAHTLTSCWTCDRSDDWTPSVVIVDGLTAILAAAGKGVEHYGLWYAKFRMLMTELRVPNALVVGHSTMTGNHSMGGTEALAGPDGLWNLAMDNVDNPRSARRFSVRARMGGEDVSATRVVRSESGRLVVPSGAVSDQGAASPVENDADSQSAKSKAEDEVRDKLREGGADGRRKLEVTGAGSWGKIKREALAEMVESGEVTEKREGQGYRYWLAEAVPS
ncbi:MAG: hypothetical protein JWM93_3777 [Frankiales bacterium]|nr:hypothetical protein [Frankiales bacterium]